MVIGSATEVVEEVVVEALYCSTEWGCKIRNNNSVSVRITLWGISPLSHPYLPPSGFSRSLWLEKEREINRGLISYAENNSVGAHLFFASTSIARHLQFLLI